MSINFATLQGLTIPEGVVTQITDASGRVLWAVSGGKVILEVEKITADTYAGETAYTGEQFILLDIYPKTNGTVKVTYGGLTKTITDTSGAEKPNAQQVFFGTFNGVSDSVTTPTNGTLVIDGECAAFGSGGYKISSGIKATTYYAMCIRKVIEWGNVTSIPNGAFSGSAEASSAGFVDFEITELPSGITSIGNRAFYKCRKIAFTELPNGITSIGNEAFYAFSNDSIRPREMTIPNSVKSIGYYAFSKFDTTAKICFLSKLIMLPTEPPVLTKDLSDAVLGEFTGEIIVPKGCGNAYKTAEYWSYYADYIVEAS